MKRVLTGLGYPDFAPNATKSSMEDVSSFEITLSVLCMGILLKFMGFLSGFGSALVLTSSIAMHAEVAKIWTEFDKVCIMEQFTQGLVHNFEKSVSSQTYTKLSKYV